MKSVIHQIALCSLNLNDSWSFALPKDAAILAIQIQNGEPVMWYLFNVEDKHELLTRTFHCIGTGIDHDSRRLIYIATVQSGPYVLHFFEEI